MSSLQVDNIQSYNANPPVIKSSSGAEVGTFCRAWVNFNGTGTVAIRQSFNVSSITDNGVGDYTVTFTTALADANYCASVAGLEGAANGTISKISNLTAYTSSLIRVSYNAGAGPAFDVATACVAIFR